MKDARKQIEKLQELTKEFNYHLSTALKLKEDLDTLKNGGVIKEHAAQPHIETLDDISVYTSQGRLLKVAIAAICDMFHTCPLEVIEDLNKRADKVYPIDILKPNFPEK